MNNDEMSELFKKFSNMVNEGNIPDEMKNILANLGRGNENNKNNEKTEKYEEQNSASSIDFETFMKMKNIMDKMKNSPKDPRTNLLLSLKPYLKESRKDKLDQYIKMFNISKVIDMFNNEGGAVNK